uniref:DDE Tnp4 domain-containing protein n=1 Tax=Anopheles epiroticus TaxID=199890 RepID=A0A182PX44_9DIPT
MEKDDFQYLLSIVGPKIAKMNTNMRNAITPQEKLLITLRYLVTGETFTSLHYVFRFPSTQDEWLEISKKFEERWKFPHAIGAIDGKHVNIVCPQNSGSDYFNYKNFYSIVLMVVVDADYNFLYADVGGKGGISDGGIFKNTRLYQRMENRQLNLPPPEPLQVPYQTEVPYFLLGDKAFAFTEYCIRPYGGMHSPHSIERIFNKIHSSARMPVENSRGILVNRFRALKGPIHLQPSDAKHIVLSTILLHNFLCSRASRNSYTPESAFDRIVNGRVVESEWRNGGAL